MSVFKIAAESIDFQSKDNFAQMVVFAKRIFAYKNAIDAQKSQELEDLVAFIRNVTKMNVSVDMLFDQTGVASVRIENINKNNPIMDDFRRMLLEQDQDKFVSKIKTKIAEASVNVADACIDGVYKLVPVKVNWSFRHMTYAGFTPEEAVAVLLHELGHVFNYFVTMSALVRQNLVLAAALKANSDKPEEKIYRHRIEIIGAAAGLSKETTMALGAVRKAEVIQTVLLTDDMREIQSVKGLANYDQVYNEAMADHFAMRYGAGAHLVTALDKANRASFGYSGGFFLLMQTMELVSFFGSITLGIVVTVMGIAAGAGAIILTMMTLSLWLRGDSNIFFEYDELKNRYKRMRNQMVEYIKLPALSGEEKKIALDAISTIDQVMEKAVEYKSPLRAISNFIFSGNGNVKKLIELEHQIEEFVSNQLFVNAAKLTLQK